MRLVVNLASRPFRNQRLPALGFALAASALVAVTAWHAWEIRRLRSEGTTAVQREVAELDAEVERLRGDRNASRQASPDKKKLAEWSALKDLVDRRTFAWTQLLSRLERVVPPGVRLVSVAPSVEKGVVRIALTAEVREIADGFAFAQALEAQPEWSDALPLKVSEGESDGANSFDYTVRYDASPAPAEAGKRP